MSVKRLAAADADVYNPLEYKPNIKTGLSLYINVNKRLDEVSRVYSAYL